jgi:SAM-dependent methyltransferase
MTRHGNVDRKTVEGFGEEWARFDQSAVSDAELKELFEAYFSLFPWTELPSGAVGMDAGCGSGRWARFVAPRVKVLHCVDASERALAVARNALSSSGNCVFHHASVDAIPIPDASLDYVYSLGVLHHVPDTAAALAACVAKLKPGAPLLLYLYYALENRPSAYRLLWRASDFGRRVISRLPLGLRLLASQVIAITVYYPLARLARLVEALGLPAEGFPLAFYRRRSFATMRTDAFDRFATRLEHRFTRAQVLKLMQDAGLDGIKFREDPPYWCALGRRRRVAN